MTLKEQLMQAIEDASEPVLVEVLDFLQFLQAKDAADIQAARASLATVATEGTVSWEALKADVGL